MYAALADDLRRDIRNGKWNVGDMLPTEKELAQQHRISRSTVRAALQKLVDMGLISRHKAVGTKVCAVPEPASYATATSSMAEIVQFGKATDRYVRSVEQVVADDELAQRLACRPGSKWVQITTLRTNPTSPDYPIGWTEIYLDRIHEHVLEKLPDYKGLIAELLLEEDGVDMDEVDQIIRPITISPQVAAILDVQPDTPALEIIRRYVSQGRLVLTTFSEHPAGRFSYRIGMKRQNNYRA